MTETLRVYLAHPGNQLQAHTAQGMAVLISYANWFDWMASWLPSYGRVLIDSGAFSVLNTKKVVDPMAYCEWARQLVGIDNYAGLDDISGDWKQSLENYKHGGFPTIHDTDPIELLPDLIALARERGRWLGIGLKPPRAKKEAFILSVLEQVPSDIHVHGWALRAYAHLRRLDSVDSTNWWRDAMDLRTRMPWLTFGECQELIVKRYQRWSRIPVEARQPSTTRKPWPLSDDLVAV